MSNAFSGPAGPSARTRTIVYSGLAGSALLVLFGPQFAEWGLALLGCPLGYGAPGAGCGGLLAVAAGPLAALAGAAPPLETSIVLVHRLWPLLLVWGIAILLSARADRPLAEPAHADDRSLLCAVLHGGRLPPQRRRREAGGPFARRAASSSYGAIHTDSNGLYSCGKCR